MSRARTYTKAEIADAAAAAAASNVRVTLHPTGEIEFAPRGFGSNVAQPDTAESALDRWLNGGETRGRA